MSTNPNQQPNNAYNGGYGGYTPNSADDPYGAAQAQSGANQQNDPNYAYGQQQYGGNPYDQQQQQQQQYGQQQNTYVPPSSVNRNRRGTYAGATPNQGPAQGGATDSRSRLRALLSYLGLCFTGIYFLLHDRNNRYVSYHAAQSIVVFAPLVVVYVVLSILSGFIAIIPIISLLTILFGIVLGILKLIMIVLWLALMAFAYLGINIRIPVVSEYTDRLMARFSR